MNLLKKIDWPEYKGFVNASKLTGAAKSASVCYDNQKRRCYGVTNPRYKDNGARGICVYYTKREFIGWYLKHLKSFKGDNPSVGRIDHSKGYSFDNIRFESLADNSLERINRVGTTRPKRPVKVYRHRKYLKTVESLSEAVRITGVSHVIKYCQGILNESEKGYSFKYAK